MQPNAGRRRRFGAVHWFSLLLSALLVAAIVPFVAALAPAAPAGAQINEPTISTPQLLTNPSFEQGVAGWNLTPGANWALYRGSAGEDQNFLETNSGGDGPGAGITQAVTLSPTPGAGYRASVMLRSDNGTPMQIGLVLWAFGGGLSPIEQTTGITVSSTAWNRHSVELDIPRAGYTELVVQIYFATLGPNLDVDGAMLQQSGLGNPSFESGPADWNLTPGANWAIFNGPQYEGAPAYEGPNYLAMNDGSFGAGASIFQDVSTVPISGHDYRATMMLRSPTGAPISAQLVVWALGGAAPVAGVSSIQVSSKTWQRYSVVLHIPGSGYSDLRVQLYDDTPGPNIDVDATNLTDAGLSNSAFEQGLTGWRARPSGMNLALYSGPDPYENNTYFEMNTGSGGSATMQSTLSSTLSAGAAYNAYVELRSPLGQPANVNLRLFTTGAKPVEGALTSVTVTNQSWERYSVELDVGQNGYSGLGVRVGLLNSGVNLDIGAVEVVVPHAAPVTAPPPPTTTTTSGGGGGSTDCTPTNSCNPKTFAEAMLAEPGVNAPATAANIYAMEVWERAEGGGAGCPGQAPNTAPWSYSSGPAANPINTTQPDAGSQSTTWNSVGVQQFQNAANQTCWYWGLYANYVTLINGYYGGIISVLQNPASTDYQQCWNLGQAVGASPWGTGYFNQWGNNTMCKITVY